MAVAMEIAQLNDAKTVPRNGKPFHEDFGPHDLRLVRLENGGICGGSESPAYSDGTTYL
jgi:hypothetical protein